MELDELKSYCKVDGDDEDNDITEFQAGAEAYLINAGIVVDYSNALYGLAVKMLVNNWHKNRETFVNLKTTKVSYSLSEIILSLQYNQAEVIP